MVIPQSRELVLEPDAFVHRIGDPMRITGPDGQTYLGRLEHVSEPSAAGGRSVVAAIVEPRRLRGRIIIAELGP